MIDSTSNQPASEQEIRILLVEDNPVEAHLIRAAIARRGDQATNPGNITVKYVSLLSAAVEAVLKEPVDVVLLDLGLPDSTGLDTLRKLREQASTVPIVVLTGTDDESVGTQAVQIGAQDYLVKGDTNARDVVRAIRYAVERHRLQQSLSLFDDLTLLHNRRGFMMLAEQHLKTLSRTHTASTLFFADMDGLKQINDTYGHEDGSKAIVQISQVLKRTFRDSDIVARIGGDEFVAIAVEATDDHIAEIHGRLRLELENVNAQGVRRYTVGLSIGAVRLSGTTNASILDYLAEADAAMYEDKQRRRTARSLQRV